MSVARSQVQRATTRLPWTTNFRHLLPIPKHWKFRSSYLDPPFKAVSAKDRIKYWNVVPGDRIRIRGEGRRLHEVMSINKFTNRVYLKGTNLMERNPSKTPVARSVHYSRCQLFMGEKTVATPSGSARKISVFARRVGVRDPHWQPETRRFEWKRIVVATIPAYYKKTTSIEPLMIPWPKEEDPEIPEANPFYDTTSESVLKITYQPPSLSNPKPADEDAYISGLFNPHPVPFNESMPVEFHLAKELANPHSRAKKQARWQATQSRKKELLTKFLERELMDLRGRSAREARAEGAFKWRQKMEEERKAEKKRRWFTAERMAKIEFKVKRKQRKAEKQKEKLSQLVLRVASNQVIPASEGGKPQRAST
ncbi:hypothetical protein HYDPIDRAFT_77176 [Hydnomerulius pinastri MD-312]|nr:hypothetical protein HYDPIDRAFT_77176 [Hydnomerulius pinastri MD-312]